GTLSCFRSCVSASAAPTALFSAPVVVAWARGPRVWPGGRPARDGPRTRTIPKALRVMLEGPFGFFGRGARGGEPERKTTELRGHGGRPCGGRPRDGEGTFPPRLA